MAKENAVPNANPDKSRGELNEGRPHPTPDIAAGDCPTDNPGLQNHHDPIGLGQKSANNPKAEKSQLEGPAAYAPHANEPTKPKEGR